MTETPTRQSPQEADLSRFGPTGFKGLTSETSGNRAHYEHEPQHV